MKKTEIKQGINAIKTAIKNVQDNLNEILKPYERIVELLEDVVSVEIEAGIETEIDFDTAYATTLISCIEADGQFEEINNHFDELLADLENWTYDVGERKQEQIQEDYIEPLEEIKNEVSLDDVECREDFENLLEEIINQLDNLEI